MNEAALRARLGNLPDEADVLPGGMSPSAVLVPVEPGRGVWLTRRAMDMPSHAGQVSFPGGRVGAGDASLRAAALREAEEEIGLAPSQAVIMGRLKGLVTGTGFHITPFVALLPRDYGFVACEREVREIFCLPFATLLNPEWPVRREAEVKDTKRVFWVWPDDAHVIWGATAEILLELALWLRKTA